MSNNLRRRAWYQISTRLATLPLIFIFSLLGTGLGNAAKYDEEISGLCDRAAAIASRSKGVPLDILLAISRTETGRSRGSNLQPWPWTVNMEGTGRWFSTLDEARSYVFQYFKNGARSFDVGCFQINYRWHGSKFRSIDEMFDPIINAKYAAEYLTALFQEFGNWPDAVGAYHSRTPELAERYTARYNKIRAKLPGDLRRSISTSNAEWRVISTGDRPGTSTVESRSLNAGGKIALGSLVPIADQLVAGSRPFVIFK